MKKINKQDLKSAMIIAFSLVIMMGSLYVGLSKGRIDDDTVITDNLNSPSAGIEDLVINKDTPPKVNMPGSSVNNEIIDEDEYEEESVSAGEYVEDDEDIENTEDEDTESGAEQASSEIRKISLNYPVKSDTIVMDYSFNTDPVYSKTFQQYRSDHEGIDFKADIGEDVFAAADGVISKIYEDEKLGYTVIISHDGYETRYANLDQAFTVKEGDKVSAGDVIGKVGSSAVYESAEDSHVHFGVYINDECVDAKGYLG